ncbi:hypothetical protein CALCODRAFT_497689 [Calocera cornea HHB12733]|uniref:Uncharacterized protein n=1 Tax=Calocera cornea HHB12733 TaxID=1353952 RepID=A0A165F3Y2_9BASI|nr:hypothetical protein CALCODRAFT_497689 [Calocera cornea HHB12733]
MHTESSFKSLRNLFEAPERVASPVGTPIKGPKPMPIRWAVPAPVVAARHIDPVLDSLRKEKKVADKVYLFSSRVTPARATAAVCTSTVHAVPSTPPTQVGPGLPFDGLRSGRSFGLNLKVVDLPITPPNEGMPLPMSPTADSDCSLADANADAASLCSDLFVGGDSKGMSEGMSKAIGHGVRCSAGELPPTPPDEAIHLPILAPPSTPSSPSASLLSLVEVTTGSSANAGGEQCPSPVLGLPSPPSTAALPSTPSSPSASLLSLVETTTGSSANAGGEQSLSPVLGLPSPPSTATLPSAPSSPTAAFLSAAKADPSKRRGDVDVSEPRMGFLSTCRAELAHLLLGALYAGVYRPGFRVSSIGVL